VVAGGRAALDGNPRGFFLDRREGSPLPRTSTILFLDRREGSPVSS
jgi:hypothetical protein